MTPVHLLVGAMVTLVIVGLVHLAYFLAEPDFATSLVEKEESIQSMQKEIDVLLDQLNELALKNEELLADFADQVELNATLTRDRDYWKKQAAEEETVFLTKVQGKVGKAKKPKAKTRKAI